MQLVNIESAFDRFFDLFGRMKDRLGPVLIQLPPGLQYNEPLITDFFELLKESYSQYSFAVEVRNRSWINDNFYHLLSRFGISFVIADSGNRYPYYEVVTTNIVYLRFHGREQLYASDYADSVLNDYAGKIVNWLTEGKAVWVFFNNDYHGYAVKNASRLMEIILNH